MEFIYHHRTNGRGAEGIHISSIVHALEAEGHSVRVVSPLGVDPLKTAGTTPIDKGNQRVQGIHRIWRWISAHCPELLFEVLELWYNIYAMFRLIPILYKKSSAIYYERYAFFLFAGVFLAKWFDRVVILEVNEITGIPRARGQVLVGLAKWLENKVFQRADATVTVSSYLKKAAEDRGARVGSVHIIPNAVDPKFFELNNCGNGVRKSLGWEDKTIIGFVGWFDDWDRLDILIDVIKELEAKHPELRLLLVGDGPVAKRLTMQVQCNKLNSKVVLTGPVARGLIPQYIDAMDVCVLPDSNPFGSPIVLFEFMAMGKAVVAPDLLPIRDVMEDEVTGLVVKPGDPIALRRAIARLIEDPSSRLRLGREARKRVMEQHTWEANGRRIAAVAKQLQTGGFAGGSPRP